MKPSPDDMHCFGLMVRRARAGRGLTRTQLALQLGLPGERGGARIEHYEDGTVNPPPEVKRALVRVLGLTVADAEWSVQELVRRRRPATADAVAALSGERAPKGEEGE